MTSAPPSSPGFPWPQFLLAAAVVFGCLQLAATVTHGVVSLSPAWWCASIVFALVGGALVAWVSARTTPVVIREVVHVAAESPATVEPDSDVAPVDPVFAEASGPSEAERASDPLDVERDGLPAEVESGSIASPAPEPSAPLALAVESASIAPPAPEPDAPLDPAVVVEAAFAAAPRRAPAVSTSPGLAVAEPVAAASLPGALVMAGPLPPASEAPATVDRTETETDTTGLHLTREWLDEVIRQLTGASTSGEPSAAVASAVGRLGLLRTVVGSLVIAGGEATPTSVRQFSEAVSFYAKEQAGGVSIEVLVRDDVPDSWRLPALEVRRALELLLDSFTDGRGRTVQLLVAQVGQGRSMLRFELRDDDGAAAGIDATRLSLRMAAWLVEAIGGRVEVPVQARAGRRILVSVPAEAAAEEELRSAAEMAWDVPPMAHAQAPEPQREEVPLPRDRASTRVLIVDDDAMARWSLTGQLAVHGYIADTAPGGDAALQALAERDYRAVVLDLQMPGMNGFEVAARIRNATNDRSDVPIVGLTIEVTPDEQRRCHAIGIDDVVAKPIQGEELAEALASLPPRHAGPRNLAAASTDRAIVQEQSPVGPQGTELPAMDSEAWERLAAVGRASGEPNLARRLIDSFESRSPYTIAAVRAAIGQQELDDAIKNGQRLADSANVVGASQMHALARALVQAAESGDVSRVTVLTDELEQAFQRVRTVLRSRSVADDTRG